MILRSHLNTFDGAAASRLPGNTGCYAKYDSFEFRVFVVDPPLGQSDAVRKVVSRVRAGDLLGQPTGFRLARWTARPAGHGVDRSDLPTQSRSGGAITATWGESSTSLSRRASSGRR